MDKSIDGDNSTKKWGGQNDSVRRAEDTTFA